MVFVPAELWFGWLVIVSKLSLERKRAHWDILRLQRLHHVITANCATQTDRLSAVVDSVGWEI